MGIKKNCTGSLGQTLLEYAMVVGIVTLILAALTPAIRRGIQAIVKVTADQLRPQNEADQTVDETSGYLVSSFERMALNSDIEMREVPGGITEYIFDVNTQTQTNALINLGFTEQNE